MFGRRTRLLLNLLAIPPETDVLLMVGSAVSSPERM